MDLREARHLQECLRNGMEHCQVNIEDSRKRKYLLNSIKRVRQENYLEDIFLIIVKDAVVYKKDKKSP